MPLILLINLKKREDRLSKMKSRLSGLDYKIIEAIDGNNLVNSILQIESNLSNNEKACVASHIKALNYFLSTEEKTCIVLEDDVILNSGFFSLSRTSNELPLDAMVLKLETANKKVILKKPYSPFLKYELYEFKSFHIGSAAYWISRSGAKMILAELEKFSLPSDNAIFERFLNTQFSKHILQISPACCIQEDCISDIKDSDIAEERKFKKQEDVSRITNGKNIFIFKLKREVSRIWKELNLKIYVLKNFRKYKRDRVRFDFN